MQKFQLVSNIIAPCLPFCLPPFLPPPHPMMSLRQRSDSLTSERIELVIATLVIAATAATIVDDATALAETPLPPLPPLIDY